MALAEVAVRQRKLVRAARLLGAAVALREETGYSLDRLEQDRYGRVMAALVDDAAFLTALAEARATDLDDVVAYALDEPRDAPNRRDNDKRTVRRRR